MAVLQLKKVDSDSKKPGAWLAGMPIACYPDVACPEPPSPTGKTQFIRYPNVSVESLQELLPSHETPEDLEYGRKEYTFDYDKLTTEEAEELALTNELTFAETDVEKIKQSFKKSKNKGVKVTD